MLPASGGPSIVFVTKVKVRFNSLPVGSTKLIGVSDFGFSFSSFCLVVGGAVGPSSPGVAGI